MAHHRQSSSPRPGAPWFLVPRPVSDPLHRLFCVPHAGAGATTFHPWAALLPDGVELAAVQIPGRTYRLSEPPFVRIGPLLDELTAALLPLVEVPYTLFGHSLGAVIVFELARRLRRVGAPMPVELLVSGRRAPHVPSTAPPASTLPEESFRRLLRDRYGTPAELIENEALMELSMPALRADFELLETWRYQPEPPLELPIRAFGGDSDPTVGRGDLEAWRQHTRGEFETHWFPGGHYFVVERRLELGRLVAATIRRRL